VRAFPRRRSDGEGALDQRRALGHVDHAEAATLIIGFLHGLHLETNPVVADLGGELRGVFVEVDPDVVRLGMLAGVADGLFDDIEDRALGVFTNAVGDPASLQDDLDRIVRLSQFLHVLLERRHQPLRLQDERSQREEHIPDLFGRPAGEILDLFDFFFGARRTALEQRARVVEPHGDGSHVLRRSIMQIAGQLLARVFFDVDDAILLFLKLLVKLCVLKGDDSLRSDDGEQLQVIRREHVGFGAAEDGHTVRFKAGAQGHDHGRHTGGANGVYWLSIDAMAGKKHAFVTNYLKGAKRKVKQYTGYKIEMELLYPLLRGRDVTRWNAMPSLHILMVQDPETRAGYREEWLRDIAPQSYQWLSQFKKELLERSAFKKYFGGKETAEFWTMYNIGDYTFAPYKVIWREMASKFTAAVAGEVDGKVCIPDHKLMLVPCKTENESHYLCALLNSSPVGLSILSVAINLQFNPHVLTRIALPKYDPKNETHRSLAAASKTAHKAAAKGRGDRVVEIEEEIDRLAAQVWNLSDDEMQEIKDSLRELGGTVSYENDEEEVEE